MEFLSNFAPIVLCSNLFSKLAIRDGAFGACYLRGLPAAGSLRSPLPLALTLHPHTLSSAIKISKIAKEVIILQTE